MKTYHGWVKKEVNENFDVLMGCFDGAEVCELVGSYILLQLNQVLNTTQLGYIEMMF